MPFAAQIQPLLAPQNDSTPSGGAKKKNKKKRSAAAKAAQAAAASPTEAVAPTASTEADHDSGDDEESKRPKEDTDATPEDKAGTDTATPASPTTASTNGNTQGHARSSSQANGHAIPLHIKTDTDSSKDSDKDGGPVDSCSVGRNGDQSATSTAPSTPTTAASKPELRAEAMTQDEEPGQNGDAGDAGEGLRAELERLRKQVEELQKAQQTQKEETEQLRADLEESEAGREEAETQYQNLMGRVEKIKETLGSRFQRDRQELEEARDRIDELEAQNEALRQAGQEAELGAAEAAASAAAQNARLQKKLAELEKELDREQAAMLDQAELSLKNWQREKDELTRQAKQLRAELESTISAMSEWEVIALEERSVRESLADKAADLEDQLQALREQYQRAADERDTQANAVDSLQRALHEIQEARRRELREMVQESEVKLEAAEARALAAEKAAEAAQAEAQALRAEAARTAPFEAEVREKNLLIGKLRHESIAINGHLVKALRYIKKMRPEDNVDKQVVTNNLIAFLSLDRSDPKRFQILQVLAGMLQWTDEQKEKAGLARPGTSGYALRMPSSPFVRTPSTAAFGADVLSDTGGGGREGRETLAELWADFLKRSVEDGAAPAPASHRPSSETAGVPSPGSSRAGSVAAPGDPGAPA